MYHMRVEILWAVFIYAAMSEKGFDPPPGISLKMNRSGAVKPGKPT